MTGWVVPVAAALVCLTAALIVALRSRKHCHVYEYYSHDGRCVYIGVTGDLRAREAWHRRNSWWWPQVDINRKRVTRYPSRPRALAAERAAIRRLHPAGNVVHNGRWAPRVRSVVVRHPARPASARGWRG